MANAQDTGVYYIDTTGASIPGPVYVAGIKYVGSSNGTVEIKHGSASGMTLWKDAGQDTKFDPVCFRAHQGLYITLTNGAAVIIYTK